MSLTCNVLRRMAHRRLPSVANKSLHQEHHISALGMNASSAVAHHHQHEPTVLSANGPLQQRRTMVVVTKSSPADDPKPPEINVTTPAAVPSAEVPNVDNPEQLSVEITPSCVKQIQNLLKKKDKSPEEMFLRVFVDPGGCSGFQYQFELDDELIEDEDFVFEPPGSKDGVRVVVDESSLKLIHGSKIDYVQEMIKSSFVVAENPQSESACGCGSSFAIKNFSANPALD